VNSDNRANSAQFQVKLPTGAELVNTGKKTDLHKKKMVTFLPQINKFMQLSFIEV
jgi:hypothetical protein